jgi:hypothetical protein
MNKRGYKKLVGFDFEGKKIYAEINFDWVNSELYINEINYDDTDIKSIISDELEACIEAALIDYCLNNL